MLSLLYFTIQSMQTGVSDDCSTKTLARMHVFEMESRREEVYSVAISIVRESFGIDQLIYFGFRSESFAFNVWLGQDDAE